MGLHDGWRDLNKNNSNPCSHNRELKSWRRTRLRRRGQKWLGGPLHEPGLTIIRGPFTQWRRGRGGTALAPPPPKTLVPRRHCLYTSPGWLSTRVGLSARVNEQRCGSTTIKISQLMAYGWNRSKVTVWLCESAWANESESNLVNLGSDDELWMYNEIYRQSSKSTRVSHICKFRLKKKWDQHLHNYWMWELKMSLKNISSSDPCWTSFLIFCEYFEPQPTNSREGDQKT